ncbi:MAG: epoxyqueuosine reductase QueH [Coriobacteriia bacterium]|nr:epoxyqueuosine reductase QueH [Coriobacteriia bacterium]MBN2839564.1 epoxyqueuosine reductase QueH [Coriobacteriia bacterium]
MRILLHACCGPCLLEPYDALAGQAEVDVCYANPNIHPAEEYERRRDTLLAYAADAGIRVAEIPYDPGLWTAAVAGAGEDRRERCRACYRLRVGLVAAEAARGGYDAVATTLTVSPYQDPDSIREEGERVCAEYGVRFLATDFRERYPEATRRSRELGMYRQNYCGCGPSAVEAADEREARKVARKAAREAARTADGQAVSRDGHRR